MKRLMLLRYGDLVLKKGNIKLFLNVLYKRLEGLLAGLDVVILKQHDRVFLEYEEEIEDRIIDMLYYIPGFYSYSIIYKTNADINEIAFLAITILKKTIKKQETLKIETKRTDKTFYLNSQEITKEVAPLILKGLDSPLITVDVHNPSCILSIEVRSEGAYVYIGQKKLLGGFPVGTGESGLVMLSGGIDSPVAAFLAIKQGLEVELIHFESTPLTPLESVSKVIDIAKVIAKYLPNNKVIIHFVPFLELHEKILKNIPDDYVITILRRMMYRIAEKVANNRKLSCLVNGESIGQVASQTLESIRVIEETTRIPIIRPVVTNDKNDIIKLARKIGTYPISIRPFNDCCSIYIPKHPTTKPKSNLCLKYEKLFDYDTLVTTIVNNIVTISIKKDDNIFLSGIDLKGALDDYFKG